MRHEARVNGPCARSRGRIFAHVRRHCLKADACIGRGQGARAKRYVLQLAMRLRGNYLALSRTMLGGRDRGVTDHHSAQLMLWRRRRCGATGRVIGAARGDCAQRGKAEWR